MVSCIFHVCFEFFKLCVHATLRLPEPQHRILKDVIKRCDPDLAKSLWSIVEIIKCVVTLAIPSVRLPVHLSISLTAAQHLAPIP